MRLLLVEDDTMIGEVVLDLLRSEHFAVDWVRDGDMADTAVRSQRYDLVLLDLGLPRRDGLDVLRALRACKDSTPVLIVTARNAVADRIAGLDAGADDYVLKPNDMHELLARIRALVRRSSGRAEPVLEIHGLRLNPVTHAVTRQTTGSAGPEPVALSAREWAALEVLMSRPGVVFSRAQIEEKLYSWKDDVSSNAVEMYIHGLRKKLGNAVIQTVRGRGYVMPGACATRGHAPIPLPAPAATRLGDGGHPAGRGLPGGVGLPGRAQAGRRNLRLPPAADGAGAARRPPTGRAIAGGRCPPGPEHNDPDLGTRRHALVPVATLRPAGLRRTGLFRPDT